MRRHLSPEEAERRLARRFAIVNVWRPIESSSPPEAPHRRSIEVRTLVFW